MLSLVLSGHNDYNKKYLYFLLSKTILPYYYPRLKPCRSDSLAGQRHRGFRYTRIFNIVLLCGVHSIFKYVWSRCPSARTTCHKRYKGRSVTRWKLICFIMEDIFFYVYRNFYTCLTWTHTFSGCKKEERSEQFLKFPGIWTISILTSHYNKGSALHTTTYLVFLRFYTVDQTFMSTSYDVNIYFNDNATKTKLTLLVIKKFFMVIYYTSLPPTTG